MPELLHRRGQRMSARIIEAVDQTVTFAVNELDYSFLNGYLLVCLTNQEAEDLMHALEGWKDER
jgi:hypothetical protein